MEILLATILGAGVLCWAVSWLMVARLRVVPRGGRELAGVKGGLSVIIPARDERENLDRLLPSLESPGGVPLEIIVVDDQSSDGTADCARKHGATVLPGTAPPDGWLGKPWACRQGVDAARGQWLLFLDADTWLEPGGVARLAALATDERAVHSVCPYHEVPTAPEQWSLFFNLVMIMGTNAFTVRGAGAGEVGLFGQALLVSRPLYEEVGGHGTVKGEVLENFHLSRHFGECGARRHCWLGKGTIAMRMFPGGVRELVAGWGKGIVSGAGATAKWAVAGVAAWFSGLFSAAIALLVTLVVGPPSVALALALYLACAGQVFWLARQAGSFRWWPALFFPAGLIFYQAVFAAAVRRKRRGGTTSWKGRDVG